jgi:polysaccharide biosynthesis protein PslE
MSHSHSKSSKRDLLNVIFRFRRRGLTVFGGIFLVAIVGLCVCPRKYSSEAKLLVRLGRENLSLDPTATTGAMVSLNNTRDAEINSVILSLSSRSNFEKVLDAITDKSEISSPLARERALTALSKNIAISSPKNSTLVVLSSLASSPERAQQIVQKLLDVGLSEHVRINRQKGSYGFFAEQSALLKSELDAASKSLRDAKNKYGIVSLEGRCSSLQQQISSVELQQQESKAALAASEAKIAETQKEVENLPTQMIQQMVGGSPNNGLSNMRQKLYELQTREQELLSRKTELHPDVIAIQEQVRASKQILDAETPLHGQAASALVTTEKAQAASLKARDNALTEEHKQLTSQLKDLNDRELNIVELERRVKLLDANYETYAKGLEQARIDDALKNEGISNLSVVQTPSFVPKPSVPNIGLTLMLAIVAATGGAIGVVLLSDFLDESIHSAAGAERHLNRRVFVALPHLVSPLSEFSTSAASTDHGRLYV